MNLMALVSCWYYNTILGWTLMYLANSIKSPLPWTQCDQDWNTPNCVPQGGRKVNTTLEGLARNVSALAGFGENVTADLTGNYSSSTPGYASEVNQSLSTSASEEFWLNNVLQLSPGMDQMNGIQWYLSLACLISLVIVFICVIRGVQTVGKVVYITATVPYILITILIIKGATLPGAVDGIIFYIKPDFSKILRVQTWIEANLQVFYSLGPCWGGLITMASYNKFSNNCVRDSIALSFLCEGTSVFAGLAIFTIVGHMAHTLDVPISTFDKTGAGLAFVVYPEAISYLPVPQLWGVLFFFMVFTVGLDSMFVTVEIILTTIADMFPRLMGRFTLVIKVAFMLFLFLSSLIFTARGGMYLFQLADWYIGAFTPLAIGILECTVIAWVYGANRFQEDIKLMVGYRAPFIFEILWKFVTPLLLVINLVFALHSYKAPVFENYTYGVGGVTIGWIIAFSSFVPIPVVAIYMLTKETGTLKERLVRSCAPARDWEPADPSLKEQYKRDNKHWTVCGERICSTWSRRGSSDQIPC